MAVETNCLVLTSLFFLPVQVSVVDSVAGKARSSTAASDDGAEVRVKQVASRDGIQYVMMDPSK